MSSRLASGSSSDDALETMCLGVPGKILETSSQDGIAMARVDFGGVVKRVCVEHVPEAQVGDYVLVHVGFALARIDEEEARKVLELLEAAAVAAELEGGAEA